MRHEALNGLVALANSASQLLFTPLQGFVPLGLAEPHPDLGASARRGNKIHPSARGPRIGVLGGNDLHRIAGLELVIKRHQAIINTGANRFVADLGVDRVSKINRGRAGRKFHDLSGRGEHVHLVAGDFVRERFEELGWIGGFPLPVHQLT